MVKRFDSETIRKQLANKTVKNCDYAFIYKDIAGKLSTHVEIGDVCFARFRCSAPVPHAKLWLRNITQVSQYDYGNAAYFAKPAYVAGLRKWLHWVVKRSPFRYAFLNGKKNYIRDGLNLNTNYNYKYVLGACFAIREAWEFPWQVENWLKLQKLGISPELSFIVSLYLTKNNAVGNHAHGLMYSSMLLSKIKWFKGISPEELKKEESPIKTSGISTSGVDMYFSGNNSYKEDGGTIFGVMRSFAVETGKGWDLAYKLDINNPLFINKLKELDNA